MSRYLYDNALVTALRQVTGDDRIHLIDPQSAILFFAQVDHDKNMYPAIVLSRRPSSLLDYQNQVAKLKGQTLRVNEDSTVTKLKLLNARFEWQIDVFTVDQFTCDEIVRELIFFFTNNPRFQVTVPYGANIPQNFDVFLSPEIEDNSDLVEFPNRGEYYRETLVIYTENGHYFSTRDQMTTYTKSDVDTITEQNFTKRRR